MSDDLSEYINPTSDLVERTPSPPPRPPTPLFTGVPLFPIPSSPSIQLAPNVVLQPPLSRRGRGPGLVIVVPSSPRTGGEEKEEEEGVRPLDPPPLQKWAEEGYAVLQLEVDVEGKGGEEGEEAKWGFEKVAEEGVKRLLELEQCEGGRVGLIVYEPSVLDQVLLALLSFPFAACLVTFSSSWEEPSLPTLQHLASSDPKAYPALDPSICSPPPPSPSNNGRKPPPVSVTTLLHPVSSPYFVIPTYDRGKGYDKHAAMLAHSKTLEFLKREEHLGGPRFELEKLWEEHTYYEFERRSVERTMATMVPDTYVNHVPTLAGGVGKTALTDFYRDHFIFQNPHETEFVLVSRTVGLDRVVDEFVARIPHTQTIDWLLPGLPPTGKLLEIPMVAIVCFRGDRLFHEHIHWDQATVLSQLSLLPSHFPLGSPTSAGTSSLVRLPVAGVEAARKLLDEEAERGS